MDEHEKRRQATIDAVRAIAKEQYERELERAKAENRDPVFKPVCMLLTKEGWH